MKNSNISGYSTADTSTAYEPSSTIQYLNSQLITHGFASSPGLQLASLQGKDLERTIRCILSLLSRRVDDVNRLENLDSRWKTLSYDHERLRGMHREEQEKSANAEREMNLFKSKLGGAFKNLEDAQKKCQITLVELSRTRSALQTVRSNCAMEIKRKEKEIERMMDRFQKLAGMGSGMKASSLVEEVVPVEVLVEERDSLMEEALKTTEVELEALKQEREQIHDVFIWVARELSALVADGAEIDPQSCIASPTEALTPLLYAVRSRLLAKKPDDAEYSRLQSIISDLNKDVESKEKLLKKYEDHFSALKERSSVDVSGNEEMARERARLDIYKLELEEERRQISATNLELEHLRSSVEAERLALLEEKQTFEDIQQSHNDMYLNAPSTSTSSSSSISPSMPEFIPPPMSSVSSPPRRSTRKPRDFVVGEQRSPKRRRPSVQHHPQPQPPIIEEPSLPIPSQDAALAEPLILSSPPFSPLPSPPGALSINGIGFDHSLDMDATPIPSHKLPTTKRKLLKHAYSPARPSPLSKLMKMSVISDHDNDESKRPETILEETTVITTAEVVNLEASSFPPMPEGLARKLASIDNTLYAGPTASQAKTKKDTIPISSSASSKSPSKSKSGKVKKPKEKENSKGGPIGPAAIRVGATGGGARRVQLPSTQGNSGGSKGGWR